MTSQTNSSVSTSTQNKSTSSVPGRTNNNNDYNNNSESKVKSKGMDNVIDNNTPAAKLAETRSVLTEGTRQKLQGIMNQLEQESSRPANF